MFFRRLRAAWRSHLRAPVAALEVSSQEHSEQLHPGHVLGVVGPTRLRGALRLRLPALRLLQGRQPWPPSLSRTGLGFRV